MKVKYLLGLLVAAPVCLVAQDDSNILQNGSFEELTDKARRKEQFEMVKGWYSPGEVKADVFGADIDSKYISAPANYKGKQDPSDGSNYAGIYAYVFRSKDPRTYIYTEFGRGLDKGAVYCVSYDVSLAELSTYAINNLGFLITKGNPDTKDFEIISSEAKVKNLNPVINERGAWYTICQTYQAKGGEKYLVLGNFTKEAQLQTQRMDAVSDITEPQEPIGYYYVDNVVMRKVSSPADCRCDSDALPVNDLIYSASEVAPEDAPLSEKLTYLSLYYQQFSPELTPVAKQRLDEVIALMNVNKAMNITVEGHVDKEELELAAKKTFLKDLDVQRGNKVLQYMVEQGVARERIVVKGMAASKPASPLPTPISLSKNRRVEFKIR